MFYKILLLIMTIQLGVKIDSSFQSSPHHRTTGRRRDHQHHQDFLRQAEAELLPLHTVI